MISKQSFQRIIIFIGWICCCSSVIAGSSWLTGMLTGHTSDYPDKVYLLKYLPLRNVIVVDTAVINKSGKFVFNKLPEKGIQLYQVKFQQGVAVAILYDDNEQITLTATASDFFYGNAKITGSVETTLFQQLEALKKSNDEAMKMLSAAYDSIPYLDAKYTTKTDAFRKTFEEKIKSSNSSIKELQEKHKGTFTADVLASLYYSQLKSEDPVMDTLYDNNLAFQHYHYFDNMKLEDIKLTFFDILFARIDEYLSNYIEPNATDGIMQGVTNLMSHINSSEVKSVLALHLAKKLRDDKLFDISEQIMKNYYDEGCAIESNRNLENMVATIRTAGIGSIAPEITLPDVYGKEITLSSTRGAKAVILYFWSSRCQYCTNAMPEIITFYNKYAKEGLKIYSVSLDENKEMWRAYQNTMQLPWLSVCEAEKPMADVSMTYGLRGTPTYILLDSNMKILLRTHTLNEVLNAAADRL